MAVVKKLISLDSNVAEELEMVAKTLEIAQKEVVERALDFYFDYTDAIIAQKLSQQIDQGEEQVHRAEEVFDQLGI